MAFKLLNTLPTKPFFISLVLLLFLVKAKPVVDYGIWQNKSLEYENNQSMSLYTNSTPFTPIINYQIFQVFSASLKFIISISDPKVIRGFTEDLECSSFLDSFLTQQASTNTTFDKLISTSGKSFSDIGLQDECVESYNQTYFLMTFGYNFTAHNDLYKFLDQKQLFFGLCLPRDCTKNFLNFFDPVNNTIFFENMLNYGYYNMSVYNYDLLDDHKSDVKYNTPSMKTFTSYLWILSMYAFIRILITIIDFLLFNLKASEEEDTSDKLTNEQSYSSFEDGDISSKQNMLLSKTRNITRRKSNSCFSTFLKTFSLTNNFKILFKKKSKYYSEKDLEVLGGIRFIAFFCVIFNQNLYGMTKLPHRNSTGFEYFSSFLFSVVKFSGNIAQCYASINGIYLGYKLMNYIKNNKFKFELKDVLGFYVRLIPGSILFMISFIVYHRYVKELGYFLKNLIIFEYFVETNINTKTCISDPEIVFYPIYFQYSKRTDDFCYPNCFKWVYFVFSEFYCFTFVIFLVYFLNKIKSRKLDVIVFLLSGVNFVLSYFFYRHDLAKGDSYTLNYVYGESLSTIVPHLFFFYYFLGINTGILYFYFKDLNSDIPISENNYNLFVYNFYVVKFFDKMKMKWKDILLYLTGFFMVLICFDFYFLLLANADKENNQILLKGNFFMDLIFIYESKIFCILFMLFLSMFLIYPKETPLNIILSSKIFAHLNRIQFAFFIFYDFIVDIFYSFYNIQIYLSFNNTFFMTLALLTITIWFSIIIMLFYEMPFRIYIKKFLRRINKKTKVNASIEDMRLEGVK